jgi:hypothetical protein
MVLLFCLICNQPSQHHYTPETAAARLLDGKQNEIYSYIYYSFGLVYCDGRRGARSLQRHINFVVIIFSKLKKVKNKKEFSPFWLMAYVAARVFIIK